ncbi:Creatinase/aminopeptidase [Rhodotorula diobovata]|uniref:Creatinase/aminopeptidase n=1 Tax=Rhodotorula diobovata TaxID=5288 RepID=A0A5C5FK48_9BASI|nr:Creatinase/aminopeptidase [Rhodotorula diobovata]
MATSSTSSTSSSDLAAASTRLDALRTQLDKHNLQAYIVDSSDAHSNEYNAPLDDRRAYLSRFTGSAGTAIVLSRRRHDQGAFLWTDGRYHQQAATQLSPDWTLMKHGAPSVPSWTEWLSTPSHSAQFLPRGSRVGLDPALIAVADYTALAPALATAGVELVPVRDNLVDAVWDAEERAASAGQRGKPTRPREDVFVLGQEFAGEGARSKIERVRKELDKPDVFGGDAKAKTGDKRCWGLVVTQLDEIAWLLNLRGSDIPYNPVFFSYLVLPTASASRPTLFIDLSQVPQATYDYLTELDVLIEPYESFVEFLEGVGKVLSEQDLVVLPSRTNLSCALALSLSRCVTSTRGPIASLKALKNPTEVQGFRDCHVRDGVALVRYFSWLEGELVGKGRRDLREYEAALRLEEFRKQLAHFRGLSFSTISSTGANASVIHYSPPSDGTSAVIDPSKIYLCDSGAQFTDGTTDVTRTLHFGEPTAFEKRAYTRVLQGHIAIDAAVFPDTTTGYMLDPWARRALWQDGLDYRHGTGHGVGHFLNVHEGPMGIGTRVAYNDVKLQPSQILSNEPGYYHDGEFGIRVENLVCVVPAKTAHSFGGVSYLAMERLTMCPIATNLVEPSLLEMRELEWLNAYNREVLDKVGPLLRETGDDEAVRWLEKACEPLRAV